MDGCRFDVNAGVARPCLMTWGFGRGEYGGGFGEMLGSSLDE
jgi:hypothetical protein